jgi:NAD(P)-dependent dehydrogenase (short-subunit alcohol dehydrogenase family)
MSDHPRGTGPAHPDALVVGASRGLGLGLVSELLRRGSRVVATVRSEAPPALRTLVEGSRGRLLVERLDVDDVRQIAALRDRLAGRTFDLLLVVAGVTHDQRLTAATISTEEFTRVLVTNALSPLRVVEQLAERVAADGTIAVMSSGQGSVSGNRGGGWEVYRASKAALNQLVRSYAARQPEQRTLLLLAPGWVRTDLGGPQAGSTVEEAVPPLLDTVEAQRGRPGLQFLDRDGAPVAW